MGPGRGDLPTGDRHPIGVAGGVPTPAGDAVAWFHDVTGDEVGHWLVERFGGSGADRPALVDAGPTPGRRGWRWGDGVVVAGTVDDDGYTV